MMNIRIQLIWYRNITHNITVRCLRASALPADGERLRALRRYAPSFDTLQRYAHFRLCSSDSIAADAAAALRLFTSLYGAVALIRDYASRCLRVGDIAITPPA